MITYLALLFFGLLDLCIDADAKYDFAQQTVLLKDPDDSPQRVHGFQYINNTDFYFGGLLRVHADTNGFCNGSLFIERGVEETEAMLFAIDSINNDPDLLPNITLGYDIRDYCNIENQALEESLDWALLSHSGHHPTCTGTVNGDDLATFAALIGPYHSRISIPTASFLRLFKVPQISYAATSPILNSRQRFEYYMRTVTPDTSQAELVAKIIFQFGWTAVSSIHSNEVYGEYGTEILRDLLAKADVPVCFDLDEGMDENFGPEDYAELAQKLYKANTNVVVLFALETYVGPLLEQLRKIHPPRSFVWIATDAWAESSNIQREFGDMLIGMLGIAPYSKSDGGFLNYYKQVTPGSNERDPYFDEYCNFFLNKTCSNNSVIANSSEFRVGTFVPFMVDAVYAAAHGLHNFLMDNCDEPLYWNRENRSCDGQRNPINGENILRYIANVSFTSPTGTEVGFDEYGNPVKGAFRIINLQANRTKVVGIWKIDQADIEFWVSVDTIQFGVTANGTVLNSVESKCEECHSGEIRISITSSCCKLCQPCVGKNYTNLEVNSMECFVCDEFMWGNSPVTGSNSCVPIDEVFLSYSDAWGVVLICLSILGIIALAVVSLLLGIFLWQNAVIKSFGREQLILILCGLALCFILPFFYIFKPSVALCVFQEMGLWFSLTLVLAALLVKLVRITRIFLSGVKGGRQLFIKPWHQVVFTFLLVSGQMIFVLISFLVVHPGAEFVEQTNPEHSNDFPTLIVQCKPPHAVLLVFLILSDTALIILINGFAIFTIRFPKNFNEARHIAFSTFAIGMVWLAFIPTYFATSSRVEFQSGSVALAVVLMAFCILICLLCPRLYVAIRNPKAVTDTMKSHSTARGPGSTDERLSSAVFSNNKRHSIIVDGGSNGEKKMTLEKK